MKRPPPDQLIDDITVTPQMVEAGLVHLLAFHPDRGVRAEESVRRIFLAMASACPLTRPPKP
jgi:hypothetical protein